ncbi:hypothetical protein H0A36_26210 [Endozoicomonas sp. SM1973]|uniref:Uncharacterized protein n=2 Tax=Spartinivicinus marinus TaxID=2994442 RepID=A0A853INT2_9GAMM|nr:hypothetical protein [Spartinivicinus marinus]NYZ69516.1 hypothetical protein [Spartinivicinus marinus]
MGLLDTNSTVTDKEGRFNIPGWSFEPVNLLSKRANNRNPVVLMFKENYSPYVFNNRASADRYGINPAPWRIQCCSRKEHFIEKFTLSNREYLFSINEKFEPHLRYLRFPWLCTGDKAYKFEKELNKVENRFTNRRENKYRNFDPIRKINEKNCWF